MRLVPERSPLPRLLLFAALPATLGALLLARLAPETLLQLAHCPLRDATGLPCPTCGGTAAVTRLAAGDLRAATETNPLVVAGVAGLVGAGFLAAAATLVPALRRTVVPGRGEAKAAVVAAALVVLGNWLWLILRTRG